MLDYLMEAEDELRSVRFDPAPQFRPVTCQVFHRHINTGQIIGEKSIG